MEQYMPQAGEAQPSYWGSAPGGCTPEMGATDGAHEALVSQVKDMQRNDPHAKEQWAAYTDSFGQGKRDPMKHTSEFLSAFLAALSSGQKIPVTDDSSQMTEVVKVLQKKSQNFKMVWTQFCKEFGGGTNDPAKHDTAYMVKFFDFISQQALQSLPGPMTMAMGGGGGAVAAPVIGGGGGGKGGGWGAGGGKGGDGGWVPTWSSGGGGKSGNGGWSGGGGGWGGEPPAKRTKFDAGMGSVIGGPVSQGVPAAFGGQGHPTHGTKEFFVAQVKAFQRIGEQQKELWGTYADMYLGGVRDPARHDQATLEEFCVNHNVPPPPAGAAFGNSGGGHHGGINAAPVGPMDPMREALVTRVKAFQKASREQSEMWKQFCGPTCDPARHEADKLQEFITLHNVP